MIDCPECKGAGKIADSYRENAKVESQKKKPGAFSTWVHDWWPIFGGLILVLGIGYGGCKFINLIDDAAVKADAAQRKAEAEKPRHGYLIVQYNDANEVQRCWLSPNKDAEVAVVGKGVYIYMADIKNPGVIPASVGVTDMSKCVSYRFD